MIKEVKRLVSFSLGTWINFGFSFLLAPISTFLLSPSEYGKYALFLLTQTLLTYLFTLGMDQVIVRFFHQGKVEPNRLLIHCIVPVFGSFVLTSAILLLLNREVNFFITNQHETNYLLSAQLAFISLLASLNNVGTSHLRMQKAGLKFSFLQVVTSVVNYAAFFYYLFFIGKDFHAFLVASLISLSVQLVIIYVWFIKIQQFLFRFKPSSLVLKQALLFGIPFVPSFLLDFLFSSSDKFFLRYFGDLESLGVYSLALRISYAFTILQSGFHLYWVPYSMERFHRNKEDKGFYRETFSILNFIILILITVAVTGKDLLKLLIDPSFFSAISFFSFLLYVPYFYTLSEITFVGINFKNKTHYHLIINLITLAFNALFAFLFIPKWGSAGAAMTVAATYGVFFILRSWIANKLYALHLTWTPFVVSLLIVSSFVLLDFSLLLSWSTKLFLGFGVSAALLFLYKSDISILVKKFKK